MPAGPKFVIVIPDGAADEPFGPLGHKTPLESASIPAMDAVASEGIVGRSSNVPARFLPASDVATLSLFGYDPELYYTGRAPLEAAAMGIPLGPDDWAVRCNLINITDGIMADFTAGHVSSEEGVELLATISQAMAADYPQVEFHPGVSYRNLMVYRGKPGEVPFADDTLTNPPHDHQDQPVSGILPTGSGAALLIELMEKALPLLLDHPVNVARQSAGKPPANSLWLWGQGKAPSVPKFVDVHGLKGAIISAVDLVRGVGVLAGWTRIDVPGATGYLDTDYAAKGEAAIKALEDFDIVCVHIEAPDEASHEGRHHAKVEAIERIDQDIVGPLRATLETYDEWRLVISPDHSTLLRTRAHDRAPVAWALAGTNIPASHKTYNEPASQSPGAPYLEQGYQLMKYFLDLSWDGQL
jgi:2,3-bisphosphoglycerate-independent phosphoglycerate mutase